MASAVLLEFANEAECARALARLRDGGRRALDAFMPYESERVLAAFGEGRSRLPRWVFAGGLSGGVLAYLVLWFTQALDYPLIVASHPAHAPLAYVPIVFESTLLAAGVTAFFGFLAACRLPRWHHPVFEAEGFERAAIDRFFVLLEVDGDADDPAIGQRERAELGALRAVVLPIQREGAA